MLAALREELEAAESRSQIMLEERDRSRCNAPQLESDLQTQMQHSMAARHAEEVANSEARQLEV